MTRQPKFHSFNLLLLTRTSRSYVHGTESQFLNINFSRAFHSSKQQSLDFSFVSILEPVHSAVEFSHEFTGLSWHWIIPLSTFLVRSCTTLPVAIINRRRTQKQAELQPLLGAVAPILRARLAQVATANSRGVQLSNEQIEVLAVKERRKRRVELFRRHKCQAWKSLVLLPSVQLPLWISLSLVFRAMCGWSNLSSIPVEPGFKTDTFLWCTDLVEADPFGALPIIIGILGLANVEWNAINTMNRAAATPSSSSAASYAGPTVPRIVANISRVGILFFMTMSFQAPTAVCLYWVSSGAFSLIQNIAFDYLMPLRYQTTHPTTAFNMNHTIDIELAKNLPAPSS